MGSNLFEAFSAGAKQVDMSDVEADVEEEDTGDM
jgi:hypothetical protein